MKALRLFLVLALITGGIYPLLVTGLGGLLYPHQIQGSLITQNEKVIGSSLIGQSFTAENTIHGRPSACDYTTMSSSASNAGPTYKKWKDDVQKRQVEWGNEAPSDLLTTSGSGLDPDISLEAANLQCQRLAEKEKWTSTQSAEIQNELQKLTQKPFLKTMGDPRINVLALNLAVEKIRAE